MKKNRLWNLTLNKGRLWKILLLMKTFIFLSIFCIQLTAANVLSQNTISIKLENANLKECISLIEQTSGLGFLYNGNELKEIKGINIDAQNMTVEEILNNILKNNGFEYVIQDEVILITKAAPKPIEQVEQEAIEIKGKVTDANGIPLPGATILENGTLNGVTTDANGNYTLSVAGNQSVLKISFIGFTTQLIPVEGKTVINVVLQESTENLSEVVITGYQTISKERATGSFSIVTEEDLNKKLNNNLVQMIEGLSTGLITDHEGNITIRGLSTFAAEKKPLIVLDGFPYDGDLSTINSDNIANITVLKDGVAASIYGARSANGVIVVTTKKGKRGEFNVSYKGTFKAVQKTTFDDYYRSSTSDYIDGLIAKYNSAPFYYYPSPRRQNRVDYLLMQAGFGVITQEAAMAEIDQYRNVNAYDQVEKYGLRQQLSQQHNISVRGGGENNTYNASINYLDERGEELYTNNKRLIVDLNNVWKPADFITINTAANIVYTKGQSSATSMINLVSSYGIQPFDPIVDENGNPVEVEYYVNPAKRAVYETTLGMKPYGYSPLDDMKLGMNYNNSIQTRLSANIDVNIIKGLKLSLGGAWTRGNSNFQTIYDADSWKMRIGYNDATSKSDPSKHYLPEGGMIDETRGYSDFYTLRTQLTYNKTFNQKHRLSLLVGNEVMRQQFNNSTQASRVGYNPVSGDFVFIDNSTFSPYYSPNGNDYMFGTWYSTVPYLTVGGYSLRDNRWVSWLSNGSYEFDNRFIISGSIRLDLTNFFGTDPKYRYKPNWSMGATYKLSKEKWFNVEWVNRLDLRTSYGINGNISHTEGPFLILSSQGFNQVSQGISYRVDSPVNDQLRWEKTATFNIATDITFFNNRFNLTFEYYIKKSTDLLAPESIDRTKGVSSLMINAGGITNKGVEISLNARVLDTKDFAYNTNVNFSYNKSHVDEYNIKRAYSTFYLWTGNAPGINEEGYPSMSIWGFPQAPLSDQGEAQTYDVDGNLIHPNNVGLEDVIYLGTAIPSTHIAWTNSFSYKNFDLSFMFVGSFGAKFWKDTFTGSNVENRHVAEAWKEPGDELTTIYPKVTYFGSGWWFDKGAQFLGSADYVKLRDLTLSYNLPKSLLDRIGFKRGRVYVQGRNLMRFTASGVDQDPETRGAYPIKAEFYTGISFEF